MLNKKPSTKSRKCWRPPETARNPKIFLFRSLPTTFQNNVKSLLCLFPRANPTRRSASKFLMNTPLGQRCGEIYKRYEAYGLGYSTGFASKAIGVVLKVDDVEALQKDLPGDFVIYSTFSSVAGIIVPRCGRLFAVANSALITAKNIDFEKEPIKESVKNLDKSLAKKLTKNLKREPAKNLRKDRQKIPSKNFHIIVYNMETKADAPAETPAEVPE